MDEVIYLSHWDDPEPVSIPKYITKLLRSYHVMGIRFLYNCYRKGQKGVILNHEDGMNFELQVIAFLSAVQTDITPKSPALILCPKDLNENWVKHLNYVKGINCFLVTSKNINKIQQEEHNYNVLLCEYSDYRLLKRIINMEFLFLIVSEVERAVRKRHFIKVKSLFCVGLTTRNFLRESDLSLFWSILKWVHGGKYTLLTEFYEDENEFARNYAFGYQDVWQKLTWHFSKTFVPLNKEEKSEYLEILKGQLTKTANIKQEDDSLTPPSLETTFSTMENKVDVKEIMQVEKEEKLSFDLFSDDDTELLSATNVSNKSSSLTLPEINEDSSEIITSIMDSEKPAPDSQNDLLSLLYGNGE